MQIICMCSRRSLPSTRGRPCPCRRVILATAPSSNAVVSFFFFFYVGDAANMHSHFRTLSTSPPSDAGRPAVRPSAPTRSSCFISADRWKERDGPGLFQIMNDCTAQLLVHDQQHPISASFWRNYPSGRRLLLVSLFAGSVGCFIFHVA